MTKAERFTETVDIYRTVYLEPPYDLPEWIVRPGKSDFILELEDYFSRLHTLKQRMRDEYEQWLHTSRWDESRGQHIRLEDAGRCDLPDAQLLMNLISRTLSALKSWHRKDPERAAPYVAIWPMLDPNL